MNWWYWTWVLYSRTIAAILRAPSLSDAPLRAYGDGIARSRKRRRPLSRQRGPASVAGMSMPPPEGFWRVTGLTNISCTAPDTDSGWKCTHATGWRGAQRTSWLQGTSVQ